jgi:hypothetical protein
VKIKLKVRFILAALTISLSFTQSFAQIPGQSPEGIPLVEVLDSLEQKFDVRFSYINAHIQNQYVKTIPSFSNVERCIQALEEITGLKFDVLNERFISISKINLKTQPICGVVLDGTTGEKLEGASILLNDRLLLTDENGRFIINEVQLADMVTIQFLGYRLKKEAINQLRVDNCTEIRLSPIFTILEEVTVRNFVVKGIDKKVDGSLRIDLLNTEILPGLTEPDILHTVQKLPGIRSINETVSDINVRGGTNDQNLILWEGVKMYKTGHFFGLISAFNPYLIEKVSLIKNGSSAAYQEGVSSIIDIETFDEVNETLEVGAGLNMINGDVYFKVPISNKVGINFSGRRSFADAVNSPTFNNYFDRAFRDTEVAQFINGTDILSTNDNFFFYDYSGKLLYDISKRDKLRVSFLNIFNQINYEESGLQANTTESKNSELKQANLAATAKYERTWNEAITSNLSVDLSSYHLKSINFDLPNNQRFIQENEVLDVKINSSINWKLSNSFKVKTGYQFYEIGVTNLDDLNNPTVIRNIKEVLRIHGQFTELNYASGSGNTISRVGLRINYFEKFNKLRFEPRIAVNQLITDQITLELLGEAKSQSTTQIIDFQTDFLGVEKRRWLLVNDNDIPIVTSGQLSLGAHYKKDNLLMSIEGYMKQVDGIISSSQGFQNQLEFMRRTGAYTSRGVDVLLNNRIGNFNLWTSYSYSNTRYDFNGFIPPRFPNNIDIRHSATLGISYQNNGLELSAGLNYNTGRPFTAPDIDLPIVNGDINYQPPNSSRIEYYLRPDISGRYQFKIGEKQIAQIGGSLWNFSNQKNVINRYYIINSEQAIQQVDQLGLGLTPNIMLRITI